MNRTKLYKAILLILFTPVVAYTSIAKGDDCAVSKDPASKDSVICGTGAKSAVKEGIAIGKEAFVSTQNSTNSIALGNNTMVTAKSSVALGDNSHVDPSATNSVALGSGSVASDSNVVSIGKTGHERGIVNLAPGKASKDSTDAVNGGQLFDTNEKVQTNTDNIKKHDDTINKSGINFIQFTADKTSKTISVAGADIANTDAFSFGKKKITDVQDGELSQSSTEVVNGSQLFSTNDQITKQDAKIATILSSGIGLIQISNIDKEIGFSNLAKDVTTFNVSDRKITGAKQGEISQLSTDIVTGSQLHSTNKLVETHTKKIANNTEKLADHTSKIANNTHLLADHSSKISNNTGRIDSLENKVRSVDSELGRMDKKIDRGLAMSAAMNGLFQPYGVGNINMSVAFGGYGDHQAVAVGSGYRVNENVAFKAAVSTTGSSKTMYNAGVNIEW